MRRVTIFPLAHGPTGTDSSTVTVFPTVTKEKAVFKKKKRGRGNSLERALFELTAVFLSQPFISLLAPSSLPCESFVASLLDCLLSSCARLN